METSFPKVRNKASRIKTLIRKKADELNIHTVPKYTTDELSSEFDDEPLFVSPEDSDLRKLLDSPVSPTHSRQLEWFVNQANIRDVLPPRIFVGDDAVHDDTITENGLNRKDHTIEWEDEDFSTLSMNSGENFEIRDDGSVMLKGKEFETSSAFLPSISSSLSKSECDKYFGVNSKMEYYKVYREMDRRSKIMDMSSEDIQSMVVESYQFNRLNDESSLGQNDSVSALSPLAVDNEDDDCLDQDIILPDLYPTSPRSLYLTKLISLNSSPTNPYYRSRLTTSLNLNARGLGDEKILHLVHCLSSLPFLKTLNIADNGISGATIAEIFNNMRHTTSLMLDSIDISSNHMNFESANAIASLLSCEDCKLQKLYLRKTKCDDSMSDRLLKSLLLNSTIIEIDFSENKIGSEISRTSMDGNEMQSLLSRNCPLSLNMSWNIMKPSSCSYTALEKICPFICLKSLDLSLNNLGPEGGKRISAVIINCKYLNDIILENCGLDSTAMFTICCSARENLSVVNINVSNNFIGEQGARSCARLACYNGDRVKIDVTNCSLKGHTKATVYRVDYPCADYDLDLKSIYSRSIFMDILFLVSVNNRYYIETCTHSVDRKLWNPIDIDDKYVIPAVGWVRIQLRENQESCQIHGVIFNDVHKKYLIEFSQTSSKPALVILYGCQNFALGVSDAVWLEAKIYEDLPVGTNRLRSFGLVIPLLATDKQAEEFIEVYSRNYGVPKEILEESTHRISKSTDTEKDEKQ